MLISERKILKAHGYYILCSYYDFLNNKKSEKITLINLMTHIRPIIEYYQKTTGDLKGEKLNLISKNLRSQYFSASKMIHPESHYNEYKIEELKYAFKIIYKIIFGKKKYKKLKSRVESEFYRPQSLLALHSSNNLKLDLL